MPISEEAQGVYYVSFVHSSIKQLKKSSCRRTLCKEALGKFYPARPQQCCEFPQLCQHDRVIGVWGRVSPDQMVTTGLEMIGVNCPSGNGGWNYFAYLENGKEGGRRTQFTQALSPLPDRTHLATAETTITK